MFNHIDQKFIDSFLSLFDSAMLGMKSVRRCDFGMWMEEEGGKGLLIM